MKVKVSGMKELEREMNKVVDEMRDALKMGVDEAAETTAGIVRSNTPEGPTGNLRRSVTTKPLPRKDGYPEVTMVGCDRSIAPHQHLVEFGTARSSPNPFFRRSIDGARGVIKSAIEGQAKGPIRRR